MVQESTNTFDGGLISDLSSLTTPQNVLTDALNATLLTFNGNELVLQNDMGNTKIEGAKLSDGFVPIGIKEYGGILYIVSYNELTKETEIGSFPSPSPLSADEYIYPISGNGLAITLDDSGSNLYKNIPISNVRFRSGDGFVTFIKSSELSSGGKTFNELFSSLDGTIRKFYKLKLISVDNGVETDVTSLLSNQKKLIGGNETITNYWCVNLENSEAMINDSAIVDYNTKKLIQRYKNRRSGVLNLRVELEDIDKFVTCDKNYSEENKLPELVKNGDNYNLRFYFKIEAKSDLKPTKLTLTREFVYLTGTPPITPLPTSTEVELNFTTDETTALVNVDLGSTFQDKIIIYKAILSNATHDITFNNFIIENLIDLSKDQAYWVNGSGTDYNFRFYNSDDYTIY